MFARLALLFIIVPLIELALLIQVGQVVGLMPTVLLVLATGFGGAALARREGLRTLASIQASLGRGEMPGQALLDGAAILFGGALLLTPGILTDFFGIALLLPMTRRWFARRLKANFEEQIKAGRVSFSTTGFGGGPFGAGGGASFGVGGFGRPDDDQGVTWDGQRRGADPARKLGLDPRNEIHTDGSGTGGERG